MAFIAPPLPETPTKDIMKNYHIIPITVLCLIALIQPAQPQRTNEADLFLARKERWAIKTGVDEAARGINTSNPKIAKVVDLIKLARPNQLPENTTSRTAQITRYGQAEKTLYTIDADIIRYRLEKDDHDFHIVMVNAYGEKGDYRDIGNAHYGNIGDVSGRGCAKGSRLV